MRLNYCRGGWSAPMQGGSRRGENNKATCPTCGKRVIVNRDGRLHAHGTRRKESSS